MKKIGNRTFFWQIYKQPWYVLSTYIYVCIVVPKFEHRSKLNPSMNCDI